MEGLEHRKVDLRIVSSINGTFSDMHCLQHTPLCQVLFFLRLFIYLFFHSFGCVGVVGEWKFVHSCI